MKLYTFVPALLSFRCFGGKKIKINYTYETCGNDWLTALLKNPALKKIKIKNRFFIQIHCKMFPPTKEIRNCDRQYLPIQKKKKKKKKRKKMAITDVVEKPKHR